LTHVVKVMNLQKKYRLGKTDVIALNNVSLAVEKGEFMAIAGASGSGKSTLLNMIGCIDTPDQGSVFINGKDTSGLSEVEKSSLRNKNIGFVFQTFNLIPVFNIIENVELPLTIRPELSSKDRRELAIAAVQAVGLEKFQLQVPDKLSGGQRQRVAIARALVTSPSLVLADEPTANLDSHTATMILDLMLELNQKTKVTFLFSTHDEKLMGRVRRIIRLQDGEIVG